MRIRNLYVEDGRLTALDEEGELHDLKGAQRYAYALPSSAEDFDGRDLEAGGYVRVPIGRGDVKSHVERWQRKGVELLEADVRPIDRALADMDLQVSDKVRSCYFDIETEDDGPNERRRIISFAYLSQDARGFERAPARTDAGERALLLKLARLFAMHDVMVGWNAGREWGDEGFDCPKIRARAEVLGINDRFDWWSTMVIDHMHIYRKYFLSTTDGAQRQSWGLDAVAKSRGIEGKVPHMAILRERGIDPGKYGMIAAYEHAPELLESYNLQDVVAMQGVEEKSGFLAMHYSLCRLVGTLPRSDSLYPTRIMDALMLDLGSTLGYHWPTRFRGQQNAWVDDSKVMGAVVMHAEPGMSEGVSVLDVGAMYPSIIRALNLGSDTRDPDGSLAPVMTDEKGVSTGEVIGRFRGHDRQGQIPKALEILATKRKEYEDELQRTEMGSPRFTNLRRLSAATKAATNAFYGVILQPGSRYYDKAVGESVTSTGRLIINAVVRHVEKCGHRVIIQDTDSAGFECEHEDAEEMVDELNNEVFPRVLGGLGVPDDKARALMRIKYEERYARLIQVATKKYAGKFEIYRGVRASGDEDPDVKGLECVRGDTIKVARDLQRRVVDQILAGEGAQDVEATVEESRERVITGDLELEDVAIWQKLTKGIDEYAGAPMHARVAAELAERGVELEGGKVCFWLSRHGPRPAADWDPALVDRHDYWDKRTWPPTERVLRAAFPDHNWRFTSKERDQMTLFGEAPLALASKPTKSGRRLVKKSGRRLVRNDGGPVVIRIELSGKREDGPRDRMRINRVRDLAGERPGDRPLVIELLLPGNRTLTTLTTPIKVAFSARVELLSAGRL